MPFSDVQAIENVDHTAALGRLVAPPHGDLSSAEEDGDLGDLRYELEQALAPEISRREVALLSVPDGLVISLLEIGFFESGSAQIKNSSMPAFTRMAGLLAQRKYRIRIEGHTDNVPIHNSRFHSNWELSTERATELIRVLVIRYDFARPKGCRRLATANITPSPQPITEKDVALTAGSTWWCWDESPHPTTQRETNLLPGTPR